MIRVSASTFGLIAALLIAATPRASGSELLANGGFEQGPTGWSFIGGSQSELSTVSSPVHGGALAGRYSGSGQPTSQFVYQLVGVQSNQTYELSGWIAASGDAVSGVFLRISWFDLNGQPVVETGSPESGWLPQRDGLYYFLTTGPRLAPSAARSARVSVYVLGNPDSPFAVHLDDLALSGPAVVPPPPATSTPAPPVTPSPPSPTTTPVSTPKPVPSATQTPAPQHPPTAAATPTSVSEPLVFPNLVNGGFEQVRPDGTPYGWRKQGGQMSTVTEPRGEGSRALTLNSDTSSTKWVYQTVTVHTGAYYEASVQALAGSGSEAAFLRLSWYASPDGSGQAIDSVDSLKLASPSYGGFRLLSTGAVQAPPDAASVKVRLMLRPSSAQPSAAYFDSAAFQQTQPQGEEIVSAADGAIAAAGGDSATAAAAGAESAAIAAATPVSLVNVKPQRPDAAQPPLGAGKGRDDWAIVLALGVAVAAVSLAGGYEWWQRRRGRGASAHGAGSGD